MDNRCNTHRPRMFSTDQASLLHAGYPAGARGRYRLVRNVSSEENRHSLLTTDRMRQISLTSPIGRGSTPHAASKCRQKNVSTTPAGRSAAAHAYDAPWQATRGPAVVRLRFVLLGWLAARAHSIRPHARHARVPGLRRFSSASLRQSLAACEGSTRDGSGPAVNPWNGAPLRNEQSPASSETGSRHGRCRARSHK